MYLNTNDSLNFDVVAQNVQCLLEAEEKSFMTKREKILKRKLINLLKDDGRGHHHARYAAVLELFDVNIVPLNRQPSTAAISFDDGIIYINEGFLQDDATFYQLNVIMRHELCHNLLMHQVRMVKKLSEIPESNLRLSMSIHELCNIIEDFEISNKKYTAEDKETVRHTWLNGKLISGLVTEDHRSNWAKMSLEEMYDAFESELAKYDYSGHLINTNSGNLSSVAKKLVSYQNVRTPSDFDDISEMQAKLTKLFSDKNMPSEWADIFSGLQWILDDPNTKYQASDIADMMEQVAISKPIGKTNIVSPVNGEILATVYTPEEKAIAMEILKIIGGNTAYPVDFKNWYDEVTRVVGSGEFTEDEIKDILNAIV